MDFDSDIERDEIYYLYYMCSVAKEMKYRYKEEEDAVMDDLWRNGVMIDKAGDPKILRFEIP